MHTLAPAMKQLTLIPLVALLATAGANAQTTIVQTKSYGPDNPNFLTSLVFDKYDGNLADLLSVTYTYTLNVSGGSLTLDNDASSSGTYNVQFGAQLQATSSQTLLDGSFNNIFNNAIASTSAAGTLAANVGDGAMDYDSTGPDGILIQGTSQTASGSADVNNAFLSQYIGSGTFTIDLGANQYSNLNTSSGIEYAFTPVTASGTVTVTYSVVPEPSAALLSLLGGLVLFRRRR